MGRGGCGDYGSEFESDAQSAPTSATARALAVNMFVRDQLEVGLECGGQPKDRTGRAAVGGAGSFNPEEQHSSFGQIGPKDLHYGRTVSLISFLSK